MTVAQINWLIHKENDQYCCAVSSQNRGGKQKDIGGRNIQPQGTKREGSKILPSVLKQVPDYPKLQLIRSEKVSKYPWIAQQQYIQTHIYMDCADTDYESHYIPSQL